VSPFDFCFALARAVIALSSRCIDPVAIFPSRSSPSTVARPSSGLPLPSVGRVFFPVDYARFLGGESLCCAASVRIFPFFREDAHFPQDCILLSRLGGRIPGSRRLFDLVIRRLMLHSFSVGYIFSPVALTRASVTICALSFPMVLGAGRLLIGSVLSLPRSRAPGVTQGTSK